MDPAAYVPHQPRWSAQAQDEWSGGAAAYAHTDTNAGAFVCVDKAPGYLL